MIVQDLGTNIGYAEACEMQRGLVERRKAGEIGDTLLLLEHRHVFTLGRNAKAEHLLVRRPEVEIHPTNRGGDITYHGPGQLVGYPILDLSGLRKDVVWYVRSIEEALIGALAEFGIEAGRKARHTGVWVRDEKIAAIGVHISRWVTSHGFALNVRPDLTYFQFIVPCGIRQYGVTSMEKLLGKPSETADVKQAVARHFERVFEPHHRATEETQRCTERHSRNQTSPVRGGRS